MTQAGPYKPAKEELRRRREVAEWKRLLTSPIRLNDGSVLFTLEDAAKRILNSPATPSTRVAASRIIEAALHNGDIGSAQAAIKLALLNRPRTTHTDKAPQGLSRFRQPHPNSQD